MTCSNGVLDDGNCRCCDFADAERYFTMKSDLANIEAESAGNSELLSEIATLKENIASIESKVIGSCGDTPPDLISGYFEIAGSNLEKLALNLKKFKLDFSSGQSCSLSCDATKGLASIWRRCQCIHIEGFEKIVVFEEKLNSIFNKIILTLYDTEEFYSQYDSYRTVFNLMCV
jgi:hypothetical protein